MYHLNVKHTHCLVSSLWLALKLIHTDKIIKQPNEYLTEELIIECIYHLTEDETVLNKE